MGSARKNKQDTTRRGFVKELSGGAAGLALAGILSAAFMPVRESLAEGINKSGGASSPGAGKYRKYFLTELTPEEKNIGYGGSGMFAAFADNDIIEGCDYFSVMWMAESATKIMGHGPHTHPVSETLVAIGTDPKNPADLGATFEMYMGEEMEKHIVDKSTLIYVPPNTVHCPFTIIKSTRPFLFIQAHHAPKLVENARRDLVPPEMRTKYIFIDSDGKSEKKPKK
jgi:hypothetical protein